MAAPVRGARSRGADPTLCRAFAPTDDGVVARADGVGDLRADAVRRPLEAPPPVVVPNLIPRIRLYGGPYEGTDADPCRRCGLSRLGDTAWSRRRHSTARRDPHGFS